MKIYLDPGHGGPDRGASVGGVHEKDVVLRYAFAVYEYLTNAGHEVRLSRDSDWYPTLRGRAREANAWEADAFVSIHANANASSDPNGAWVLHHHSSDAGEDLAHEIFNRLRRIPGIEDADDDSEVYPDETGWVGNRSLAVLRETTMPAVLVELGFLTNADDLAQLQEDLTVDLVAAAIARGVIVWGEAA